MALAQSMESRRKFTPSPLLVPGAQHINLESLMISNPYSDALHHYRWANQQRCYLTDLFNATQCQASFERLPSCLEAIQVAYEQPTRANKKIVMHECQKTAVEDLNNRSYENVRWRCAGRNFEDCVPEAAWAASFFNDTKIKAALGVPGYLNFSAANMEVFEAFKDEGDLVQQAYLLYEPLLEAGYRLLRK
ncbi:hypothetical protein EIP86_008458 [Pleurotus ostreatoroseus]|nr:hypothetical protein EIP86_008458 [Pleurotus ostreatoroseus]